MLVLIMVVAMALDGVLDLVHGGATAQAKKVGCASKGRKAELVSSPAVIAALMMV